MANMILKPPFQPFTLPTHFKGIFNAEIYCGVVDSTDPKNNQVQAYVEGEDGALVEIPQPITTNGGGFAVYNGQPAKIVLKTAFSLVVYDKTGVQRWYEPNMAFFDPETAIKAIGLPWAEGDVSVKNQVYIFTPDDGAPIYVYDPVGGNVLGETPYEDINFRNTEYTDNDIRFWMAPSLGNIDVYIEKAISEGAKYITLRDGSYKITSIPDIGIRGFNSTLEYDSHVLVLSDTVQKIYGNWGDEFQLLNTSIGINCAKSITNTAYAVAAFGDHAIEDDKTPSRVAAFGNLAAQKMQDGYSVDAIGTSSLQSSYYASRCTAVGANSGKWNGTNNPVLNLHDFYNGIEDPFNFNPKWPTWRADWAGAVDSPAFIASSVSDNSGNVSIGRNSGLHGIIVNNSVRAGYNAHAHALNNTDVVAIGYNSARDSIKGDNFVSIGSGSMTEVMRNYESVSIGSLAMRNNVDVSKCVAIGYAALNHDTGSIRDTQASNIVAIGYNCARGATNGNNSVFIGSDSGKVCGSENNVSVGYKSLKACTTGGSNTAIGNQAASRVTVGEFVTAIGQYSGVVTVSGGSMMGFNNVTCIGANSKISGDNQVQLGDSATTTYSFGAVQDRSDARDKADINPISDNLISFFMDIEWRTYRFNYRDDYIENYYEDGEIKTRNLENDGTKTRSRHHIGAIAQQVESAMVKHGVDFAGLQHHILIGGDDIYTIGYQEFIGLQGEIIQRQQRDIEEIKNHLGI